MILGLNIRFDILYIPTHWGRIDCSELDSLKIILLFSKMVIILQCFDPLNVVIFKQFFVLNIWWNKKAHFTRRNILLSYHNLTFFYQLGYNFVESIFGYLPHCVMYLIQTENKSFYCRYNIDYHCYFSVIKTKYTKWTNFSQNIFS